MAFREQRVSENAPGAIAIVIIGRWLIRLISKMITKAMEKQKVGPTIVRGLDRGPGHRHRRGVGRTAVDFAAGAFILVLQPFKVGDYVLSGEVEGTVRPIGLFNTAIDSPDNVLTAQLDHTVDPRDAIHRLKSALPKIDNVLAAPQPDVEIMAFNERGPLLAVRPYVHNDHYWQVYFDTNRAIRDTFGTAGYPVPEAYVQLRQLKTA